MPEPTQHAECRRLLELTLHCLHCVIEGDDVALWQVEELASDISAALHNDGNECG